MSYILVKHLMFLGFALTAFGSLVFVPSAAWFFLARRHTTWSEPVPEALQGKKAILIGASVGEGWKLEKHFPDFDLRYYCSPSLGDLQYSEILFCFDKTPAVDFYANLPMEKRPDGVILKECSAYFPPNPGQPIPEYEDRKKAVRGWVKRLQEAGIKPILATVAPVTTGSKVDTPGRSELIRDYNDWVREYAASMSLAVLDLEKALRRSDEDRSLPASKSTDGMHLVPRTYGKDLDPIVYPTLLEAFGRR